MAKLDVNKPEVMEAAEQIIDVPSTDGNRNTVQNMDVRQTDAKEEAFEKAVQKAVEERLKLAGIDNLS